MTTKVYCIIATHNRPELLKEAVLSVVHQTQHVDCMYIVNDGSDSLTSEEVREWIDDSNNLPQLTVMTNKRKRNSASGAWNTAIEHIENIEQSKQEDADIFLAFLDDDDTWESIHIETCLQTLEHSAGKADVIVSGIVRHTSENCSHNHAIHPPEDITPDLCMVKNPHIQGSNLFVRLEKMLEAGLFDENLPSCTDRDLVIRLLDVRSTFSSVDQKWTVNHNSLLQDRLSTRGSETKTNGLRLFYHKYRHRMTVDLWANARAHASELFDFDIGPFSEEEDDKSQPPKSVSHCTMTDSVGQSSLLKRTVLLCGIISDKNSGRITKTLKCLYEFSTELLEVHIYVLENSSAESLDLLSLEIDKWQKKGLKIVRITESLLCQWKDLFTDEWMQDCIESTVGKRRSIAISRTIIQKVLYAHWTQLSEMLPRPEDCIIIGSVLDDDKIRYHSSKDMLLSLLSLKQESGEGKPHYGSAFGVDFGCAPLPALATLRSNLLNYATLKGSSRPAPKEGEAKPPSIADHDFVPQHLETVSSQLNGIEACPKAFLSRIIRGSFQSIVPYTTPNDTDSIQRGGISFIFEPTWLDTPNLIPTITTSDGQARRSDFVWAWINRLRSDSQTSVKSTSLGMTHDRRETSTATAESPNLRDHLPDLCRELKRDLYGYGTYQALEQLKDRYLDESDAGSLHSDFIQYLRTFVEKRISLFRLNLYRVRGLSRMVSNLNLQDWPSDRDIKNHSIYLSEFDEFNFRQFSRRVLKLLSKREETKPPIVPVFDYFRRNVAKHFVSSMLETVAVKIVGLGKEGVVLKSERSDSSVFKYMDLYCLRRDADTHIALLSSLRAHPFQRIPQIRSIHAQHKHLAVETDHIDGRPYERGLEKSIVCLLWELMDRKLIFSNFKPENLIEKNGVVYMVDIGTDLKRSDGDVDEENMIRRAFLTCKWAHRDDLSSLFRKDDVPELFQFNEFKSLVKDRRENYDSDDVTRLFSDIDHIVELIVGICSPEKCLRVLDYGCGELTLFKRLRDDPRVSTTCLKYVGFDTQDYEPKWRKIIGNTEAIATTDWDLVGDRFDIIVCAKVFCSISEDGELKGMIQRWETKLLPGGEVYFSVCNPFFANCSSTWLQTRDTTKKQSDLMQSFAWKKKVGRNPDRIDHHRPFHMLKRMFLKGGFSIVHAKNIRALSESVQTSSDFLFLQLGHSRKVSSDAEQVSLIIKTCAQEWETLKARVYTLVDQLEGPQAFHERILVIDAPVDEIARSHAEKNEDKLSQFAEELQSEGYIDKIFRAPTEQTCQINKDYFDIENCAKTHADYGENGLFQAPVLGPLAAFEAVLSPYVVQVDSDLVIVRQDKTHNWLHEYIEFMEHTEDCLTISLEIVQANARRPFTTQENGKKHRVEVRGCIFCLKTLLGSRPWPPLKGPEHVPRWHRSLDKKIEQSSLLSVRGGSNEVAFIHPENHLKKGTDSYMHQLECAERGWTPHQQQGNVNMCDPKDWKAENMRDEEFVFVVCGLNVPADRVLRCIESIEYQDTNDGRVTWHAIIVNDGNNTFLKHFLDIEVGQNSKFTVINPKIRMGSLANHVRAIKRMCADECVVITLDLDDCLCSNKVLLKLKDVYNDPNVEATVGSMLHSTKKEGKLFEYVPNVEAPRSNRGGNVWQHLRTFRARLFKRIQDKDLRQDNGEYFDAAADWAYMIPIVEMARRTVYITEKHYFYEPSGTINYEEREASIAEILKKPQYKRPPHRIAVIGSASDAGDEAMEHAEKVGRALAKEGYDLLCGGLGGIMESVARGFAQEDSVARAIGILPSCNPHNSSQFLDIVLPTGLDNGRNCMIGMADAIISICGGAGSLMEASSAWIHKRLIITFSQFKGTSAILGDLRTLDHRTNSLICEASTVEEMLELLREHLPKFTKHTSYHSCIAERK